MAKPTMKQNESEWYLSKSEDYAEIKEVLLWKILCNVCKMGSKLQKAVGD